MEPLACGTIEPTSLVACCTLDFLLCAIELNFVYSLWIWRRPHRYEIAARGMGIGRASLGPRPIFLKIRKGGKIRPGIFFLFFFRGFKGPFHHRLKSNSSIYASIEEREIDNSLLPLPDKLRRKILEVNFIEMSELLPEVWMSGEEELPMFRSVLMMPKKRAGPVTDIMLW